MQSNFYITTKSWKRRVSTLYDIYSLIGMGMEVVVAQRLYTCRYSFLPKVGLRKWGEKKLEIKRIENKSSRQATFSKRRNGLMKKAKQLSVLCDVDVAAVVISGRGRLFDFSSTNSVAGIIQRYHNHMKAEDKDSEEVNDIEESKYAGFMAMRELLETVEKLEKPEVDDLSITDLVNLENQVGAALTQTRSKKTHMLIGSIKNLQGKGM